MTYKEILQQHWGYEDFRGIQREIIESIGDGHDTLGLMPTGGGKSITFQVPALAMNGLCLVITPLISLMEDQVQHLRQHNIVADYIHSGMRHEQILQVLDNCIMGQTKFLYIAPERLDSELFRIKLQRMDLCFICVDEAHCISQWGYDFRPSYLKIAEIRSLKPGCPILALTATATPRVIEDIQKQLRFSKPHVFKMSFHRPNLSYVIRQTINKMEQLIHILNHTEGSAIVYTRNRDRTSEVAKLLDSQGISATSYHAGHETITKRLRQNLWQKGQVRVMVATNAFGMGIDKPDVRVVVHLDPPDSIEAYFQEAGRAGRDGKRAYAVLLYNNDDMVHLHHLTEREFPPPEYIQRVYNEVAYFLEIGEGYAEGCCYAFNEELFCHTFHHWPATFESAMKILARAGYMSLDTDPDYKSRLRFQLERDELYLLDNLTPMEETITQCLLRNYTGLFIDFVHIDEQVIAVRTSLTPEQVYATLKQLSSRGIISYIPSQSKPLLHFISERTASPICLSPEVYDLRKADYESRMEAMTTYITNKDICRARMLLAYFGEEFKHDCGICDVCV